MANDLSITQNLKQLTITLPADAVTVDLDVKDITWTVHVFIK